MSEQKNAWQITFIFQIKITLAITLTLLNLIFEEIEKSYFKILDLVVFKLDCDAAGLEKNAGQN